ncbi:TPA: urea carboxylase, partial [Klebsiella quasipneumoniae subsp. similipneumoniae]|nr:urea carboxylase [Klebsiella quasipneumoniae subsp. similipneumoniae]
PVQLSWYQADDEDAATQALLTRDENQRAFRNTQLFVL